MSNLIGRPNLDNTVFKQLNTATLTLSGTTDFEGVLKSKGVEINASLGYATGATGTTKYVLTLIGSQVRLSPNAGGGGSTGIYDGASPTTTTVGGLTSNTAIYGCSVNKILEKILVPAIVPSSSLSISTGGAIRQFGDTTTGNLGWSVTKNTNNFTGNIKIDTNGDGTYETNVPAIGGNQSGSVSYTICGLCASPVGNVTNTSETYNLCAITTTSEITQSSSSISWSNYRFWFKSGTNYVSGNDALIQTILNSGPVIGSEPSTVLAKSFSSIIFSNEYFYYVFPSFFGVPNFSVNGLPNNAWGNLGTGTLFTISFTNSNGYSQTFYVAKSDQKLNTSFTIVVS